MRIVSLVPSVTETLFALGLDDQIVAITTFCRFPEDKVVHKTKIGGTKNPDRQKILELKPDVIISEMNFMQQKKRNQFQIKSMRLYKSLTFHILLPH
jgi:ABC-type Fe3+-hydroxamate transport system substrate-binding protein